MPRQNAPRIFTRVLLVVALTACGADKAGSPAQGDVIDEPPLKVVNPNEDFELAPNGAAILAGQNVRVRFSRVIEDQRCPKEVQCAWEGFAEVEVHADTLQSDGTWRGRTMHLLTPNVGAPSLAYGHAIEFRGLSPENSERPPRPADYVATLRARTVP